MNPISFENLETSYQRSPGHLARTLLHELERSGRSWVWSYSTAVVFLSDRPWQLLVSGASADAGVQLRTKPRFVWGCGFCFAPCPNVAQKPHLERELRDTILGLARTTETVIVSRK